MYLYVLDAAVCEVKLVITGWQPTGHPGEIWPRKPCPWFMVSQEAIWCILSGELLDVHKIWNTEI